MAINLIPPQANKVKTLIRPSRSNATVFEAFIMIALLAVSYPYLIHPKQNELSENQARLTNLKKDLGQFEQTKSDLENLKRILNKPENAAKINVIDEALPLQTRVTRTYELVDDLISRSALTKGNLSVDQSIDLAGVFLGKGSEFALQRKVIPVNIDISLTGTIDNFAGFLQLLEQENRVFDLQSLDITPEKEGSLAFHMVLKTYLYAPQQ